MFTLLTALLATVPPATPLAGIDTSRTRDGVTMPEAIDVGGQQLTLNGLATRKKFVVKVYVAALYVSTKTSDADQILGEDSPRRMIMHFLRGVDKKKICDAWQEGLVKNTPDASAELKQQFVDLCGMMANVKDDDELIFTYVPEQGTEVSVAGSATGTLPGKDFADAILRCWIGPKPGPGDGFKKNLLGIS
jgi:hypothetical protein